MFPTENCLGHDKRELTINCGEDFTKWQSLDMESFQIAVDCGGVILYDDDGHWHDGANQNCNVLAGKGISGPCSKGDYRGCINLDSDLVNDVKGVTLYPIRCSKYSSSAMEYVWTPLIYGRDMSIAGIQSRFVHMLAVFGVLTIVGVMVWLFRATKEPVEVVALEV